jgi:carboxypeptidase Q
MPDSQTSIRHHSGAGNWLLAMTLVGLAPAAIADAGSNGGADASAQEATLGRIRDAAMRSDWAYKRLADLSDKVGARLSGSPQLDAAIAQVA